MIERESFGVRLLAAIASDIRLIPEGYRPGLRGGALEVEDPATGARYRVSVEAIDPPACEHGVGDGDYCEPCSMEYRRARAEFEADVW